MPPRFFHQLTFETMQKYENLNQAFIAGKWRDGSAGDRRHNINPWTEEVICEVVSCSADDVDEAYRAAEKAQPAWEGTSPAEKQQVIGKAAQIMQQRKEEIVEWLVKESGSTQMKAALEWQNAYGITMEAASFPSRMHGYLFNSNIPGKENRLYRRPLGVIGVISPWNFPLHLTQRSLAAALATGNAVVLKPASDTMVTGGTLLAKIFEEAGLPEGLLSVVMGKSSEIGDPVVEHPVPRLISFTGSTKVGSSIAQKAGKAVKKVSLELGGNNVMLVLDDADLDYAVQSAIFGKFLHQGQICIALNRIMVHEKLYEDFAQKFTEAARKLPAGNPQDKKTVIGPIINSSQLKAVRKKLDDTLAAGAKQLYGGETNGLLMPPVVLRDVTNDMPAAREEIFGPVAPLISFKNEEEALQMANSTPYGLSGSVHGRDVQRAANVASGIKTGMVHVNDQSVNDEPMVAFGGEKASGIGRFGGEFILEEFTTLQWISVQHRPRNYPFPQQG